MVSPAAMYIECAADALVTCQAPCPPDWLRKSQMKELTSFGDVRAQALGATGLSDDFRKGYELGLTTMRVLLMGNLAAVQAKVDL